MDVLRLHTGVGGFSEDMPALGIPVGGGYAALATVALTVAAPVDVNASAAPVQLLAPNAARVGATVVNNGGGNLHLNYVNPTSGPNEVVVPPGGSTTLPERYAGVVTGWWEGPISGTATVSELHV